MTRVLICGSRAARDKQAVFDVLDRLHGELRMTCVIEGAAPGIDTLAGEWADITGIERAQYPADWSGHGKRAGPVRNQLMLETGCPDMVIAFPGGAGTADMVRRARKAGLAVRRVNGEF